MTSRQRTIGYRRLFNQRGGALYSRPAGRLPLSQPANGFRIIGCVWNSEVVRRLFRRDNELRPYASAGKTASKRVALQDKKKSSTRVEMDSIRSQTHHHHRTV